MTDTDDTDTEVLRSCTANSLLLSLVLLILMNLVYVQPGLLVDYSGIGPVLIVNALYAH